MSGLGRLVLAITLALAGASKILADNVGLSLDAISVAFIELMTAFALLQRRWPVGLYMCWILAAGFLIHGLLWPAPSCHCFGTLISLNPFQRNLMAGGIGVMASLCAYLETGPRTAPDPVRC